MFTLFFFLPMTRKEVNFYGATAVFFFIFLGEAGANSLQGAGITFFLLGVSTATSLAKSALFLPMMGGASSFSWGRNVSSLLAFGAFRYCWEASLKAGSTTVPAPLKGAPYIQKLYFGPSNNHIKSS